MRWSFFSACFVTLILNLFFSTYSLAAIESKKLNNSSYISSIAYNPNNPNELASGSGDGKVRLWDVKEERIAQTFGDTNLLVDKVIYNPRNTNQLAVTHYEDKDLHVWNKKQHKQIDLQGFSYINGIAYNPRNKNQLVCAIGHDVSLWNIKSKEYDYESVNIENSKYIISDVAYKKTGNGVAWVDKLGNIYVSDLGTKKVHHLAGPESGAIPKGDDATPMNVIWIDRLLSDIHVENLGTGEAYTFEARDSEVFLKSDDAVPMSRARIVRAIAFNPMNDNELTSAHDNGHIIIWDVLKGKHKYILEGHKETSYSIAYNSTGTRLASGSKDGTIKIWSTSTGELIETLTGHEKAVSSVAFNPKDDNELASGSEDGTIRIWKLNSCESIKN